MPLANQTVMQMSAIRRVDTTTGEPSSDNGHGHIKNRNGPDGCRHDESHGRVLPDRALKCHAANDEADQHAAGIAQKHFGGREVEAQKTCESASK